MGTGYIPASVTPQIGWLGQTPLPIPGAGLSIVPGAGLVGRTDTVAKQLLIDSASIAASQAFNFFAPGAAVARTLGLVKNLHATGQSLIALLAANFLTAPTAGDGTNFWRVKVTDSRGNLIVLPVSAAGTSYYDLNQFGGVALVQPGTYAGGGGVAFSGAGGDVGEIHTIVPSQTMNVGGLTYHNRVIRGDNNATLVGNRVRCTLLDAQGNTLQTAIVYTTGTVDGSGFETWNFYFPGSQTLLAGSTYYLAVDVLLDFQIWSANFNFYTKKPAGGNVTSTTGNVYPATIDGRASGAGIGANCIRSMNMNATSALNSGATIAAIQALTPQAILQGTAPKNICSPVSADTPLILCPSIANVASPALCQVSASAWALNGGPSGVAPAYGNVTVAVDSVGAPAAGAAGSDMNLLMLMLPS